MRNIGMHLIVTALLSLFVASLATAQDRGNCQHECDALAAAKKRVVVGKGKPNPDESCFFLVMSDPQLAVSMTVYYRGGGEYTHTLPVGSAKRTAGKRPLPMFCISRERLLNATFARVRTDGGCRLLTTAHLKRLYRVREIPIKDPACLLPASERHRCPKPPM